MRKEKKNVVFLSTHMNKMCAESAAEKYVLLCISTKTFRPSLAWASVIYRL